MSKNTNENAPYSKGLSIKMAERLRGLREKAGKTREDVANELSDCDGDYRMRISIDSLRKYECTNESSSMIYANDGMKVGYLRAFADYYGVSPDYLLGLNEYKNKVNDMSVSDLGLWEKSASNLISSMQDSEDSAKWMNLLLLSGYTKEIAELMKNHYIATIVGIVMHLCVKAGDAGTQTEQEFLAIAEKAVGEKAYSFLSNEEKSEMYNMFCCACDNLGNNPVGAIVNSFGGSSGGLKGMYEAQGSRIISHLLMWSSALSSREYYENLEKRLGTRN